jgi:regulator of RNase E activity RraA
MLAHRTNLSNAETIMSAQKHVVITDFPRPSADLVAKVAKQHVGVAGFEAGPRQVMHAAIKPLNLEWRICGPALTVRAENWEDRLMGELAPKYAKPGDVIVVDAGGYTDVAVWGMSMTINAKRAGVAGVVIDGSTMNSTLIGRERQQIPVFARGVVPTAKGSDGPGSLNIPVICGGVIVYPGDIILADSDGVVVLRPEMAEEIIRASEAHDNQARGDVKQDVPYYERKNSEGKLRTFKNVEWR